MTSSEAADQCMQVARNTDNIWIALGAQDIALRIRSNVNIDSRVMRFAVDSLKTILTIEGVGLVFGCKADRKMLLIAIGQIIRQAKEALYGA